MSEYTGFAVHNKEDDARVGRIHKGPQASRKAREAFPGFSHSKHVVKAVSLKEEVEDVQEAVDPEVHLKKAKSAERRDEQELVVKHMINYHKAMKAAHPDKAKHHDSKIADLEYGSHAYWAKKDKQSRANESTDHHNWISEEVDTMSEEQLDELSKTTLGSYVKKAATHAADYANVAGIHSQGDSNDSRTQYRKWAGKQAKRLAGVSKAVGKLTKEGIIVDDGVEDLTEWNIKFGDEIHNSTRVPIKHLDTYKKHFPGSRVAFRGPKHGKYNTSKKDATHFYIVNHKDNKTVKESEGGDPTGIKIYHKNKKGEEGHTIVFSAQDAHRHEKELKKGGHKVTGRALMFGSKEGERHHVKEEIQGRKTYAQFVEELAVASEHSVVEPPTSED